MSGIDRKGRSKGTAHVRLDHSVFYSAAYRSLAPIERAMLWEVIGLFKGNNNGALWLGIRDAAMLVGAKDKGTASKALKGLIDRGLIAITSHGHFKPKAGLASSYRLTWLTAGSAPSNEWRQWKATPGSPDAERLNVVAQCKLRSGFSALSVRKNQTEVAKSDLIRCTTVRENRTVEAENLVISRSANVRKNHTHLIYHGGRGETASIKACKNSRVAAQKWIERGGRGAQGQLAGAAGLSASKLSRFLNDDRGRRTLRVDQLERLNAAIGIAPGHPGGRSEAPASDLCDQEVGR